MNRTKCPKGMVARGGIDPLTRGFSVLVSRQYLVVAAIHPRPVIDESPPPDHDTGERCCPRQLIDRISGDTAKKNPRLLD